MIRRLLLENLPLKAAALMLAILLWLFVSSKGQMETSFDVPIEYINIPRGIEISTHVVKSANIVIRGHESILKNIRTITKTVGIRPVIIGSPQSGYSVKTIEVKPKDVVIEGAESEVGKVGYLKTEPVDITGVAEDVRQEVELAQSDRNIRAAMHKVDVIIKMTRRER
jgi:YbbR domain-containing protein